MCEIKVLFQPPRFSKVRFSVTPAKYFAKNSKILGNLYPYKRRLYNLVVQRVGFIASRQFDLICCNLIVSSIGVEVNQTLCFRYILNNVL